jgi:DNA-binding transcriptional MocR family regulator
VREGRLQPGGALPTVRELASTLGVSPATVAAAYRALAARAIVRGEGRRGTKVAPRPPLLTRARASVPEGLRNLADGNPDPALLPPLRPAIRRLELQPRLYGEPRDRSDLIELAAHRFERDGIGAESIAVMGGGMEAVERVLQAHLRPGDRVAVEDPGFTGVLDLVAALGLNAEPVRLDDCGPLAGELERALRAGARAFILTPRAQNPTGAALDRRRARELRSTLELHPEVLVIEDDHAGDVAGSPARTLSRNRARWAVVQSVSKSLGPDLRLAVVAGDAETIARVAGRQALGSGWVSHVLQATVASLWSDPATEARLRRAAESYAARREILLDALADRGVEAHARSGLNVWIPVAEELRTVTALMAAGWAIAGGERYRIQSPPAVRITISTLDPAEVEQLADAIARSLAAEPRTAVA